MTSSSLTRSRRWHEFAVTAVWSGGPFVVEKFCLYLRTVVHARQPCQHHHPTSIIKTNCLWYLEQAWTLIRWCSHERAIFFTLSLSLSHCLLLLLLSPRGKERERKREKERALNLFLGFALLPLLQFSHTRSQERQREFESFQKVWISSHSLSLPSQ